jgi:hypothetical protein
MKKTLYLLAFLLFFGCTPYEIEVNYSEQSGYLTDVYSVKYGLSGFWMGDDEYTIKCDQYGLMSAYFLAEGGYLIDLCDIFYEVYQEQAVFILKINRIGRQGLYSPSEKVTELKKMLEVETKSLETEINENKIIDIQYKISRINAQIERLENIVNLINTYRQKPMPDIPLYLEIIKLDTSTCIVEYDGETHIRTKMK